MIPKFNATKYESGLILLLAKRAKNLGDKRPLVSIRMDLDACSSNGCPLDFDKLCTARDADFMHDVGGIARFLDRDTGKLTGHFHPKCARKS
jgi:hypothetical protein